MPLKKRRSIILLDELPDLPLPSPKRPRRKAAAVVVQRRRGPPTTSDRSGTLVVDRWKSAWAYRRHHVRVVSSLNAAVPVNTTFVDSKRAGEVLGNNTYFQIHTAIAADRAIRNCVLEYTITKEPVAPGADYLRGDRPIPLQEK